MLIWNEHISTYIREHFNVVPAFMWLLENAADYVNTMECSDFDAKINAMKNLLDGTIGLDDSDYDRMFLSCREWKVMAGLEWLDLSESNYGSEAADATPKTVEDLLHLYTPNPVFGEKGELTDNGQEAYNSLLSDLHKLNEKLPHNETLDPDRIERQIDDIIRLEV